MRTRIVTTIVATAAISLLLSGCSLGQQAAQNTVDNVQEEQLGPNGSIDVNEDGSIEIETDDESISIGGGDLPEGWPSQLPSPTGFEIQTSYSEGSGEVMVVSWYAEGERPEDIQAYVDEVIAAGYQVVTAVPESGIWQLDSAGQTVNIVAVATGEVTTISVSVD